MKKLITYLACPYSHPDFAIMEQRFHLANKAAAELMKLGKFVFSPISHTHPIALSGSLPLGWEYWEQYDRAILAACGEMLVLQIPGWKESTGVKAEILIAQEMGIPVTFYTL